ncbi:MAG: ATP-binding protein [Verrucomicrobiota bacterium]|nr:ATP-binding protein [Verrucomicrobiota bacterium]
MEEAANEAEAKENQARGQPKQSGGCWHNDFSDSALGSVISKLEAIAKQVGLANEDAASEDAPRPFSVRELPAFVEALAADVSGRDMAQFVDSLNLRIRGLFAGGPLSSILDPDNTSKITLDQWLKDYVGENQATNGPLAVLDLSLVPSEVIHIVIAVLARMVFEAVQRHRRLYGTALPTVLVLEEAHTFVHRDLRSDSAPAAGRVCCRVFERIAREGRKFGLGLVLASQRPSEMSETVLAQCNTFLLHRLVNDRDQELVRRLVPEGHGDLLRELPSLPSRRAILLGWAAPAPVLIEVRELPEAERPHSPDPEFWNVWTGTRSCDVDWARIANEWQGNGPRSVEPSGQQPAGKDATSA